MTDYFPAAVEIILDIEGPESDNPADTGGDTIFGLSRAAHPGIPWPPTLDQAEAIYRSEYWDKHNCGSLPWPWALAIFDAAVNQPSALKLAQESLGVVQDGVIGPATVSAILGAPMERWDYFMALRGVAYGKLANAPTFLAGWLKRLMTVSRAAGKGPS
jgi:lysozyme family protein